VEPHLLRRLPVNLPLGDRDPPKNRYRVLLYEIRKPALLDEVLYLAKAPPMRVLLMGMLVLMRMVLMFVMMLMLIFVPMLMILVILMILVMVILVLVMMMFAMILVLMRLMGSTGVDAEAHPFDLLPLGPLEMHVEIPDVDLRQLPFERRRFQPEVAQGADHHVAADAREAIEIEDTHVWWRLRARPQPCRHIREAQGRFVERPPNNHAVEILQGA